MPLDPDSRLGPYQILSPLGAGGMGEVYRARDSRLDREVAIKILPENWARDPERSARFEREARVLGNLNHPQIATLHGYEAEGETRFLVMELVPGETLAERIARGPMPVEETVALFLQIAEGLEAAHAQGVIHRDLKPANVKITGETPDSPGRVKILDFGLAKALAPDALSGEEPARASESPTLTYQATLRGEILGTAAYMSPEQARGKMVDRRTDVWAFGACLFEALTGARAFQGETPTDVIAQIVTRDPAWNELAAATPIRLRQLLRRCLERDPRRRLRDIGDAWVELDAVAGELAGAAPAEGTVQVDEPPARAVPRLASRLGWLLSGAAVSALALWAVSRPPPPSPEPVTRFAIDLGPTSAFPVQEFSAMLAVSRDGRELAVSLNRGDRVPRLYRRSLDRLDLMEIPGPQYVYSPFFSPDGEWIGYQDPVARKLMKIPLEGGAPQALCDSFPPLGATWLMDDSIVFVSRSEGSPDPALYRVRATGGEAEPLFEPSREGVQMRPAALPDDRGILFDEYRSDQPGVGVLDLATGRARTLIDNASNATYTNSGHLVFFRQGALWTAAFDLASLSVTGPETQIEPGVEGAAYAVYALSPNGLLVYSPAQEEAPGGATRLTWVDRTGAEEPAADETRSFEDPRISPDGRRLAVVIRQGAPLSRDVWVYDLAGRPPVRLTPGGMNGSPVWTPDGSAVTFAAHHRTALFTVPTDGGDPRPVAPGLRIVEIDRVAGWTADGKELLLVKDVGMGTDLVAWSQADGDSRALVESDFIEIEAALSHDGRWVAYVSNLTGTFEVYVRPYSGAGAARRVSATGGRTPRFSPEGDEIFFASGNRMMAASFAPVAGEPELGAPVELFRKPAMGEFDVGPDGRFLMILPAGSDGSDSSRLVAVEGFLGEITRRAPATRRR